MVSNERFGTRGNTLHEKIRIVDLAHLFANWQLLIIQSIVEPLVVTLLKQLVVS